MSLSEICAGAAILLIIAALCYALGIFVTMPAATSPEQFSDNMGRWGSGAVNIVYLTIFAAGFAAVAKR